MGKIFFFPLVPGVEGLAPVPLPGSFECHVLFWPDALGAGAIFAFELWGEGGVPLNGALFTFCVVRPWLWSWELEPKEILSLGPDILRSLGGEGATAEASEISPPPRFVRKEHGRISFSKIKY